MTETLVFQLCSLGSTDQLKMSLQTVDAVKAVKKAAAAARTAAKRAAAAERRRAAPPSRYAETGNPLEDDQLSGASDEEEESRGPAAMPADGAILSDAESAETPVAVACAAVASPGPPAATVMPPAPNPVSLLLPFSCPSPA